MSEGNDDLIIFSVIGDDKLNVEKQFDQDQYRYWYANCWSKNTWWSKEGFF